jgi:hypothetical protein
MPPALSHSLPHPVPPSLPLSLPLPLPLSLPLPLVDPVAKKYPPQPPPHSTGAYNQVIHDYPKEAEADLDLKKGELVWVFFREEAASSDSSVWCQGYKVMNGVRSSPNGTFPSTYVSEDPVKQDIITIRAARGPPGPPPGHAISPPPPPPRPASSD